jgi:hypothetical protein
MERLLFHSLESRGLLAVTRPPIICGFDLLEPLHIDGVGLGKPVPEGGTIDLISDLAIPKNGF